MHIEPGSKISFGSTAIAITPVTGATNQLTMKAMQMASKDTSEVTIVLPQVMPTERPQQARITIDVAIPVFNEGVKPWINVCERIYI